MSTRLERIAAATTLDELYAIVPKPMDCDGSCWDSCGPIGYTVAEGKRMAAAGHLPPNVGEPRSQLMCTALDRDNRCSIYAARPMICRLWGVSEPMPCPHGSCWTPDPLTFHETQALMAAAERIGGRAESVRKHYGSMPAPSQHRVDAGDLQEILLRGRKEWNC